MTKLCFNYESGKYELITEDGFSLDQGQYVYNYDDSEYRSEEEDDNKRDYENENDSLWNDDDENDSPWDDDDDNNSLWNDENEW